MTETETEALELAPVAPGAQMPPATREEGNLLWGTCRLLAVQGNELVPRGFWGRPEAMMAAILLGRDLGIPDMIAMRRIYVVSGTPTLSADLVRALIRRAGHSLVYEKRDSEACVLSGTRRDGGDSLTVTWTLEDARTAGLTGPGWQKYPRAMLDARATTELGRALFSDCLGWAIYAPEDFDVHEEA